MSSEIDYPRPHLRRKLWLNLNGYWLFTVTATKEQYPNQFDSIVHVPFPIESRSSRIYRRVDSAMYLWYKIVFQLKSTAWNNYMNQHHRTILHFDKVDYETVVYVNRNIVGRKHLGGYAPFSYDISPYLNELEENELIVRVWDPSNRWYQPRGKQMLDIKQSDSIYHTPCSGIWGTVWLEQVPYIHIEDIKFQTELSSTKVILKYRINLRSSTTSPFDHYPPNEHFPVYSDENFVEQNQYFLHAKYISKTKKSNIDYENLRFRLKIRIIGKNGTHLRDFQCSKPNTEQEISFPKSSVHLWSPEHPYLYNVSISLYQMGKFVERVESYIGFRQISLCSNDKNNNTKKKICLNGKPYRMLGVIDEGYWPDGIYRAPNDEAYRNDIEKAKSLGFNTIRKHMKSEPWRWYYWCDVLGMFVWQDMPARNTNDDYDVETEIDQRLKPRGGSDIKEIPFVPDPQNILSTNRLLPKMNSAEAKHQFEYELKAMVDFLSFHPSIVVWVLFNEGWGQYEPVRLSKWLQLYDQSRLVNSASGWQDRVDVGHMRDVHDYSKETVLLNIDDENQVLVIGECGGFGLMKSDWDYNFYNDSYLLTYAFEQLIVNLSPHVSAMIYKQLTDVENESSGILTYDRRNVKFIQSNIKRILRNDFSQTLKLKTIYNFTPTPLTNYTSLSLSKLFNISKDTISVVNPRFYFYTCYQYSAVDITIDRQHTMLLVETRRIANYHYILLPTDIFRNSEQEEHSLDVNISYRSSFDRDAHKSYTYKNRTFFYLSIVMIWP